MEELFMNPTQALTAQTDEEKLATVPDYGWFVMLMSYVRRRLPTMNDFCVICDRPHVFASGNMLKPAVCSRELCCWSFQQLGVGADAAEDIATEAEVVDLLVCMTVFAVKNTSRRNLIFDPYPLVFDPNNKSIKLLDPEKKDFNKVEQLLNLLPSVEKMTQAKDFGSLKKAMDDKSPHCFPLLQWIISSNRSHIVQINESNFIKSMNTRHQYLLLSAPPEKELKFRELKKTYGSVFAFHGSSIENWHSILRRGLVNASGTSLQVNGAAYGSGIYLSPHAQTSFGYSRIGYNYNQNQKPTTVNNGNRFLSSQNVSCIAICEVINNAIRKSGSIWVQPSEDHVVTRFFFVYETGEVGNAMQCNTENQPFVKEITDAMDYYKGKSQQ
uniref:Poly [ADP-ribose] polymerase n=1 Tax=Arcella intermedia TaxID=1963864 RepID=A0A6B2L6R2_9EUKA